MARLLRTDDYLKYIQTDNLLQVIETNYNILIDVEQAAQAEMYGYLRQRYITEQVFTDTTIWSPIVVYYGKNLVYLTASAFNAALAYVTNDLVTQAGYVYRSKAGSIAHAFSSAEWDQVGLTNAMFYVKLPNPEYDPAATYSTGDVVWYADKTYTAKSRVSGILPTDSGYWTVGATYTVTGTLPSDATKWTPGDNRNQLIVMRLIDITLFHIHSRINPRNIPDLRKERYDGNSPAQVGGAIRWLKMIAAGDVNVNIPGILPVQNLSVNWGNSNGGDTFKSNIY